jgi:hypothetical protein
MREAIDGFVASTGFNIPEILLETVVVHHRLGDMLSVGMLEPARMARALHTWSLKEGLRDRILRFEVIAAGIMWKKIKGDHHQRGHPAGVYFCSPCAHSSDFN